MKLSTTVFATLALVAVPVVFASPSIVQRQAVDNSDGSVIKSNGASLFKSSPSVTSR